MYTDYQVITDYSLEHLESTIQTLMTKDRWQPIGGISVTLYKNNPDGHKDDDFDTMLYAQALVR